MLKRAENESEEQIFIYRKKHFGFNNYGEITIDLFGNYERRTRHTQVP